MPIAAVGVAACVASPAERAARNGDLGALHEAIVLRERAGSLSKGEAAALAHAVAERDLKAASGAEAVDRVRDVRPCAHELDGALASRMQTHDQAGAQAALARLETGELDPGRARAFANDVDPHWRAVAARTFVRPRDRPERLSALLDPEPSIRRQAARAARLAADPADLAPLFDVARLDPDPLVRTEAVRALAALPALPQHQTSDGLRDLWPLADEGLREDIVFAWASPKVWNAGGREALRHAIDSERGAAAIEAAAVVLRSHEGDVELVPLAVAELARAIESGPASSRLQAIAQAQLGRPDLRAAVKSASQDGDLQVRVGALARLAETNDDRAREELESLAQPGSPLADRARFALAIGGDRRVQAWVEQDLAADRPERRLAAAAELAALGVAGRAAPLLADTEAAVRIRTACTILMAARRP